MQLILQYTFLQGHLDSWYIPSYIANSSSGKPRVRSKYGILYSSKFKGPPSCKELFLLIM